VIGGDQHEFSDQSRAILLSAGWTPAGGPTLRRRTCRIDLDESSWIDDVGIRSGRMILDSDCVLSVASSAMRGSTCVLVAMDRSMSRSLILFYWRAKQSMRGWTSSAQGGVLKLVTPQNGSPAPTNERRGVRRRSAK
jgi:hypothetical protein